MRWKSVKVSRSFLLVIMLCSPTIAQNARLNVRKDLSPIPKDCESLAPASLEPAIDLPALVKEAICKGSGDMLNEYAFEIDSVKRGKDKKGKIKEERITYEVLIPTLNNGTRSKGVLVVTSRNRVPVQLEELEEERTKAAERIEKEEDKIARETPAKAQTNSIPLNGMSPLGMYARNFISPGGLLVGQSGAILLVTTYLKTCELTFVRREKIDGRETFVFSFTPRPDATFADSEKYIAQLRGEIRIDAQDRIVTRLAGWPAGTPAKDPPAVYVEMIRLPQHRIWLPKIARFNGVDYPRLFDGIAIDSQSTFSNYIRFSSHIKDVKVEPPHD